MLEMALEYAKSLGITKILTDSKFYTDGRPIDKLIPFLLRKPEKDEGLGVVQIRHRRRIWTAVIFG
ncbi:hypothetical protein A7K50_04235 [Dehalobacter sp. MCB1]|nr:hypothetical protein A7K50_04235 [Dehalobacter sp. MCB1]